MTKKKLLAKAKEMGLEVSESMTKSEIQSVINDSENAPAIEDVVIEFTPSEEPVTEETVKEVADLQIDLIALSSFTRSELYAYARENGISIHRGLSRKEAFNQIKKKMRLG